MKTKLMHAIFMMVCLFACTVRATERIQGIEQPVIDESTIHFTYNPKGGPLEEANEIEGVAYIFKNYKWEIVDVKLEKGQNLWDCEFIIPKDCAFIAFKFLAKTDQGVIIDTNNDNGFMYTPITGEKQKIPGSYLAWGTFRSKDFNQQFGNYFNEFSVSQEATELWIKKEIKENMSYFPLFIDTYINLAKIRKPDDYIPFGNKILHRFLKDFPKLYEPEYLKVKNLFAYTLQNKTTADSLENIILQKFPKGIEMRFLEFQKMRPITESTEKISALNTFLNHFPNDSSVPKTQGYIYDKVYQELFKLYFTAGNYEKIETLLPQMNFLSLNGSYNQNLARAFSFKTVKTKELLKLSKLMIAQMMAKKADMSYMSGLYWSPNQSIQNATNELDGKLKTHIKLLYAEKEYAKALSFFSEMSKKIQYTNSSTNELHMLILEQLNQPILPLLEKSASYNALSPLMIEKLKEEYTKEDHGKVDFDAYLKKLTIERMTDISEKVKSEMIDIESPIFEVENRKGKKVKIEPSNDKIIVVDFWATWCGPCKKAFPGMQMAVDRYKKDKDVEFYFISTMETHEGYKERAETYIKKKEFSFNSLFDKKPAEDKTNDITFSKFASIFESTGIPRKVVIKNGKIRYTSEGTGNNPLDLLGEFSAVIEILKSEKN